MAELVELYGTRDCPYTADAREDLEWRHVAFTEYDVEVDAVARDRLLALINGQPLVPIVVTDGRVTEIGWRGRGCYLDVTGAGEPRVGKP